jgi:hypothetical protein
MILVDSSALVEYYRPRGIPDVQAAVTEAIEADAAAVNGIIQVEVLAFASGRDSLDELLHDFKVFHRITLQEIDFTTRAAATVSSSNGSFKAFHELAFIIQDDVNLRYAGGTAVPNLAIDDDAENSGQKAVNYRAEPLWYRGGWGPETPLTGNGPGFRTRQLAQFDQILSNAWTGTDPETPVFEAQGHPWLERPYVLGTNSTQIGTNSISEWFGTRGGVGPSDHFDGLVPDGAGGKFKITGDYLYRSYAGPRLDAGIWGILRIIP